jgi:hypothetical protein
LLDSLLDSSLDSFPFFPFFALGFVLALDFFVVARLDFLAFTFTSPSRPCPRSS